MAGDHENTVGSNIATKILNDRRKFCGALHIRGSSANAFRENGRIGWIEDFSIAVSDGKILA